MLNGKRIFLFIIYECVDVDSFPFAATSDAGFLPLKTWKRNQSEGKSSIIPILVPISSASMVEGGLAALLTVTSIGIR
jgi:hypothetical protein